MHNRYQVFLIALLAGACSDSPVDPGPMALPESELRFVQFADSAPPLTDSTVTFWAVRGEDREVNIGFVPDDPSDDPEEFLEFEVPGGALLRYPDGRTFTRGDSVQITVTVLDPTRFLFRFEPAGLMFNPEQPARLEVSYRYARRDQDGEVEDERTFGFWRQEAPGELWHRMATVKFEDLEEAEADIFGFTRYALASD
jgi:hypothetical protein